MKQGPILVTGASGKTGRAVVAALRERAEPVRAMVRRADRRAEQLAAMGAEVVVADAFDPGQVATALDGARSAYFVPLLHPHALHAAVVFATAARRSRLGAVVGLSQWLAGPDHPALATRHMWLVEELFGMLADAAHVTVNPGYFADNYLVMTGMAAQLGVMPLPTGSSRNAPPSNEDIARVVAAVLRDPEPHAGRTYRPTGPELLTAADMAERIGQAVGRKVRHVDIPLWMYLRALRVKGPQKGVDRFVMSNVRHYIAEHELGTFAKGAPTTHVRDVTGAEPESFLTTAQRYAALPDARRTPANLLRELRDLTLVGVVPTPRLDRLARAQQHPMPPTPQLAGRSGRWAREHDVPLHETSDLEPVGLAA